MRNPVLAAALVGLAESHVAPASPRMELADLARIVRVADPQIAPDGKSVVVLVSRANEDDDRYDAELVQIDVASGKQRSLTYERRGVSHPRFSPAGDRLAFLASVGAGREAQAQIFVMAMSGGDARRLTSAPAGVQQFAWSPDGRALAFATTDEPDKKAGSERHNDSFEIGNDDFLTISRPLPTHIWLVSADGGQSRRLTSGDWSLPVAHPPGSPPSPLNWSPDGQLIAFTRHPSPHSGDRRESTIQLLNVASGGIRPLTSAKEFEGYAVFSPDGTQVAYWYPRDGSRRNVNEVFLAPASGGAGRSLTRGIDRNLARALWMPDGKALLVGGNNGKKVSLWLQPLEGAAQLLNIGAISPASSFWVDVNVGRKGDVAFVGSEPNRPAELYYMTSPSEPPQRLTDLNHEIAGLDLGRVESIEWHSDGLTHNGVLTYPPQFTDGKKYPLVLLVHGGPRSASLLTFSPPAQLMAARGWVVFQPNYRGSDHIGNAYQAAIFNDAGDGPGRDVMAGIAAVRKRGFVDESRVAVSGWSYGGYMTTWLLGHYPGWRVAVAGAAVTDWLDQYNLNDGNVAVASSFGGSPWTGSLIEAYRAQSPITFAPRIRTPTLVMSDTGDFRVTVTQSYKLYHALKDNGVPTQFIGYPIPGHNANDPVRARDVQRRWIAWIERYFAEPGAPPPASR